MKPARAQAILCLFAAGLAGCNSKVEEAVKHDLIDGDSAQFRDIQRCTGDRNIYRGEVNAKNRMGAYTGFEPFFYNGISVAFASSPSFQSQMDLCYSDLHDSPSDAPSSASSENTSTKSANEGRWITSEDVNPVDDSKTRRALLIADEGKNSRGDAISLTIRCKSNTTELYVNWNDYLGDDSHDVYDDWKYVTVRVGDEKAHQERWSLSTDNNATFTRGSPITLIQKMLKAKRLVLQTTPYNENPITAVFDLTGIEKAVTPIAEECGWSM